MKLHPSSLAVGAALLLMTVSACQSEHQKRRHETAAALGIDIGDLPPLEEEAEALGIGVLELPAIKKEASALGIEPSELVARKEAEREAERERGRREEAQRRREEARRVEQQIEELTRLNATNPPTYKEWQRRAAYIAGVPETLAGTSRTDFYLRVGRATSEQHVGTTAYLYWECSDGRVQLGLLRHMWEDSNLMVVEGLSFFGR